MFSLQLRLIPVSKRLVLLNVFCFDASITPTIIIYEPPQQLIDVSLQWSHYHHNSSAFSMYCSCCYCYFRLSVEQASLIGLSLSYCVSLAGVFQYGVRLSTEVESLVSLLAALSPVIDPVIIVMLSTFDVYRWYLLSDWWLMASCPQRLLWTPHQMWICPTRTGQKRVQLTCMISSYVTVQGIHLFSKASLVILPLQKRYTSNT